ncbi:F-box/LRR-repeat protein At3g03360-like [Nicotiana sylvestris]|nr:PREDICTED: putative FBD-associated F-box protein At5g56400 isoform X2 [Nicotiana sylvestris]XP_009782509.1 PREDICTED: putative FBD-associated F-box protein At5g56400 isoform X2 [Nicotiana sylvestris]XP_016437073.1 PREDICTED: putative FBD-associated F-box protein At5g56400 isoform X2 [Nicotiana tabacum]XP_016437075.1 PREDICTED: putative FBD-associated F-box protein At5g56400 isoform X2 [Nicotiana tabacum]
MKKRKRKGARQRKVNTKKGKRMEITNTDGRAADDADRISELPEHILHHILCLLRWPKDIVRTSILSKKWKVIWESLTSVDFDQRRFQNHKVGASNDLQSPPVEEQSASFKQVFKESLKAGYVDLRLMKFILFVENTLATRIEPLPSIQKFRLHVSSFVADLMTPYMNNWISVATDKNVKELDIHVKKADDVYENVVSQCYVLPQVVFASRTITSLKLHGCGMDVSAVIKLQNLQELSMKAMRINENVVHKFVQGCPLIEDMRLIKCHLLKFLHVSTLPKLKRLEVHEGSNLRSVKLEAPNLETFWFHGKKSSRCKLILAGCGNLKNLMLRHTHMSDKSFQERIAEFPLLENLFLLECHALRRMTILSDKLKKLSVVRCSKLKEANIDAPNLLSFEYTGIELPFSSMNASQLQEVKLHLKSQKQKFHPLEVQKFVQGFEAKGFKLFLASKQDVIIYEEMRGIHLLPSRDFKIELTKSSRVLKNLLSSHLRQFHPKTLILMTSPSSDLLAFKKEIMMNKEKTPSCCKYYSKKCWRHYLEDIRMFEFSPSNINPNTSFELKWRSSPLPLPEDTDITEMDESMVHRDTELTDVDE